MLSKGHFIGSFDHMLNFKAFKKCFLFKWSVELKSVCKSWCPSSFASWFKSGLSLFPFLIFFIISFCWRGLRDTCSSFKSFYEFALMSCPSWTRQCQPLSGVHLERGLPYSEDSQLKKYPSLNGAICGELRPISWFLSLGKKNSPLNFKLL